MKIPVLATAVVAAAVATMIGLGIWQLHRAEWKKELLAQYERAPHLPEIGWPNVPPKPDALLFRKARGFCLQVTGWRAVAGRNLKDEPGWSHIAACRTGAEGPGMQVDIGWSTLSNNPAWRGGPVSGIIAPDSKYGMRLISLEAAPGLVPSAPPTTGSIPNNHLLYAIQWFCFAAAALVIYALALRKKRKEERGEPKSG